MRIPRTDLNVGGTQPVPLRAADVRASECDEHAGPSSMSAPRASAFAAVASKLLAHRIDVRIRDDSRLQTRNREIQLCEFSIKLFYIIIAEVYSKPCNYYITLCAAIIKKSICFLFNMIYV